MSQSPNPSNPYAQFGQPGQTGYGGDYLEPQQQRTSITAVISLVVSIVGCCVAWLPGFMVMFGGNPGAGAVIVGGPGAFAAIIGGLAVFFISQSQGRLRGLGLAVTGIVLGLLQAVLWIFIIMTVVVPMTNGLNTHFVGPIDNTMMGIEKGDPKAARAMLTPAADKAITDEMLADFATRYRAEVGAYTGAPHNMWDLIKRYMQLGQAMQGFQNGGRGRQQSLIPFPGEFAKGGAVVVIQIDPNDRSGGNKGIPVVNIGIMTNDGKQIWLMDRAAADALSGGGAGGPLPPPPGPGPGPGPRTPRGPRRQPPTPPSDTTPPSTPAPTPSP